MLTPNVDEARADAERLIAALEQGRPVEQDSVRLTLRALLAFTSKDTPSGEELEEAVSEGRDDGATYVMKELAELLGVVNWSIRDGSETWEGDVWATMFHILEEARVVDEDKNVARLPTTPPDKEVRVLLTEWERLEQEFHDALPQGQGETGDGGIAGRALCQFLYDNSDILRAHLSTPGMGETARMREQIRDLIDEIQPAFIWGSEPYNRVQEKIDALRAALTGDAS